MRQEPARDTSTRNKFTRIARVPFSEIPGQSKLFLRYLDDPRSLERFYPNSAADTASLAGQRDDVLAGYRTDREALCDALTEINRAVGAGAATLENIEKLRRSDTVAVLTGQQAGLFLGPLYTIYKALSAIKLAQELDAAGVSAVPIFWVATEDHDLEEVSTAHFADSAFSLFSAKYEPNEQSDGVQVGSIVLDKTIEALVKKIVGESPKTAFADELRALLQTWRAGATFADAFGRSLMQILGRFGLIVADPMHTGLKRLSAPLYAETIEKADELGSALSERSAELENLGYLPQVVVDPDHFPLFLIDEEGRRVALRNLGNGRFKLKHSSRELSASELLDIAQEKPERLSPAVMFRPVVQDFLFPTIAYFGGAAEVAYFAQAAETYRVLGRRVTPIFHRQSFTIVGARHARAMEKLELDLVALFRGEEAIRLSAAGGDLPATFDSIENIFNSELDRLNTTLSGIDPTVAANLAKRRKKMLYHIAALRKKALLADVRRDEMIDRRISELYSVVLPNGGLQERTLNIHSYVARYGSAIVDSIYDAIDLDDRSHRVIYL